MLERLWLAAVAGMLRVTRKPLLLVVRDWAAIGELSVTTYRSTAPSVPAKVAVLLPEVVLVCDQTTVGVVPSFQTRLSAVLFQFPLPQVMPAPSPVPYNYPPRSRRWTTSPAWR